MTSPNGTPAAGVGGGTSSPPETLRRERGLDRPPALVDEPVFQLGSRAARACGWLLTASVILVIASAQWQRPDVVTAPGQLRLATPGSRQSAGMMVSALLTSDQAAGLGPGATILVSCPEGRATLAVPVRSVQPRGSQVLVEGLLAQGAPGSSCDLRPGPRGSVGTTSVEVVLAAEGALSTLIPRLGHLFGGIHGR